MQSMRAVDLDRRTSPSAGKQALVSAPSPSDHEALAKKRKSLREAARQLQHPRRRQRRGSSELNANPYDQDRASMAETVLSEDMEADADPEVEAEPAPAASSEEPAMVNGRPYRGKCLYQSRKCENERALKRNGKAHNLCEEHRSKQNQHQRKFDAKKFSQRRRKSLVEERERERQDLHHHSHAAHVSAAWFSGAAGCTPGGGFPTFVPYHPIHTSTSAASTPSTSSMNEGDRFSLSPRPRPSPRTYLPPVSAVATSIPPAQAMQEQFASLRCSETEVQAQSPSFLPRGFLPQRDAPPLPLASRDYTQRYASSPAEPVVLRPLLALSDAASSYSPSAHPKLPSLKIVSPMHAQQQQQQQQQPRTLHPEELVRDTPPRQARQPPQAQGYKPYMNPNSMRMSGSTRLPSIALSGLRGPMLTASLAPSSSYASRAPPPRTSGYNTVMSTLGIIPSVSQPRIPSMSSLLSSSHPSFRS